MLDTFFQTHKYLVEHVNVPIRRGLMDEINWNDRLIAIKGSRGVGKTTFLLQYAKERFGQSRDCLYVNFNNLYFSDNSFLGFVDEFARAGGKTLLLDQTFKYPNWSAELRECYFKYPQLHIVFSASPVMRLTDENPDLKDIVKMYNLRGLSFREYLNLQAGTSFPTYTLEEIVSNHASIARKICEKVHPLWYFQDYLHHGYYPFYLENRNYSENLLKTINMMLEVDILMIRMIDVAYLSKIKQLFHMILSEAPCSLNVSALSEHIDMSRATTMNYIKYLKDARLLNLLYYEDKQWPSKPNRVYVQNTNIAYSVGERNLSPQLIAETFFYNALHGNHKINATERTAMFLVDGKYYFDVSEKPPYRQVIRTTAVGNVEQSTQPMQVPLWLFGFLY
ncbi:MAG: AAA family ATPase [Bacteroidales bacterium]|nr:AAA family ATPase [Bacteroidales bacterium]